MAAQPRTASRADRRWLALTWLIFIVTAVLATTFTPIKLRLETIAARRYQPHGAAEPVPAAHLPPGTLLTEDVLRAFITDVVREELARRDHG